MESGSKSSRDTEQLHQLGYAQELRRGMKTFSNFAVSFTIISILSGCLTLFGFAMNVGGPAVMTLGWLFVGAFTTLVALGMAEVASSYPTAGGLYYWAAKLAPASGRNPAKWSWFVGWFNLIGQVAVTAGIDFGLALFTTAFLNLAFAITVTPTITIVVYGVMLLLHALLNTFGISIVKLLNDDPCGGTSPASASSSWCVSSSTSTRGRTLERSSPPRSTTPASTAPSVRVSCSLGSPCTSP